MITALLWLAPAVAAPERREVPDYDGRDDPPPTAGEVLAWIPRILLSPAWVAERYVLYPPVRASSIWVEQNEIPVRIHEALSIRDDDYLIALLPTGLVDFGLRPSVGLVLSVKDLGDEGHRLRLKGAWGGNGWGLGTARYTIPLDAGARGSGAPFAGSLLEVRGFYVDRPDQVFYGIGPAAPDQRTRFRRRRAGAEMEALGVFGELDGVSLVAGVEDDLFGIGRSYQGDPTIDQRFDTATIAGFDTGFMLARVEATLTLDTRHALPPANDGVPDPGSGARLELSGRQGFDLVGGSAPRRWSAEVSTWIDLTGRNRNLGWRQLVAGASTTEGDDVLFTELVTLGGDEVMRGFLDGRFRGETATVTGVQYSWPVWAFLDGVAEAEVGGVFGRGFQGWSAGAMSASFACGVRSPAHRDSGTQILVGLGTSPLSGPVSVDTVRLVVGSAEGF